MENNKLIKADGIWYKIKRYLSGIGKTKEVKPEEKIAYNLQEKVLFSKEKTASKLAKGEITSDDLTDEEVDEMIEYFEKDIESKNREIERIKTHIISIKNQ